MHPNTITVKEVKWVPGNKWDCGEFSFTAETPAGVFRWHEVVPGPRHSDDAAEYSADLEVKVGGKTRIVSVEVDEFPDFGVPCQDGTVNALRFHAKMERIVERVLAKWFEDTKSELDELLARTGS